MPPEVCAVCHVAAIATPVGRQIVTDAEAERRVDNECLGTEPRPGIKKSNTGVVVVRGRE